jgi:hypothetical protein
MLQDLSSYSYYLSALVVIEGSIESTRTRFACRFVESKKSIPTVSLTLRGIFHYQEKKRLLSSFGGDSVRYTRSCAKRVAEASATFVAHVYAVWVACAGGRGISAKERLENTSIRVGLRLPQVSYPGPTC